MNTLISKLLGTAVGVKIGNDTIIGLLVDAAWDENLQISELSLSPSENLVYSLRVSSSLINQSECPLTKTTLDRDVSFRCKMQLLTI